MSKRDQVREAAPSSVEDDQMVDAAGSNGGVALRPTREQYLQMLIEEREPSLASLIDERTNTDTRFYTGLYGIVADRIRQLIDYDYFRRNRESMARYLRDHGARK